MSLTSILNEKGRTNLRDWFKFHFPNPRIKDKIDIIVSPKHTEPPYLGEIGTAFDYLFRFNLERINNETYIKKTPWLAEAGLFNILNEINQIEGNGISIGYYEDRIVDKEKFKTYLLKEFEEAKSDYNNFLKDGKITMNLLKSTVILAKLDYKIRDHKIDKDFDKIEVDKLNELKELYDIVPWDKFKAKENCSLNPYFGFGSSLVGGADADLIFDNTLIDIKTTKNLKLQREYLNQIIGYYLLSIIERNDIQINQTLSNTWNHKSKIEEPEIKNIGIYFARFGYLWQIPLTYYYELEYYEELADEFTQLVQDRNLNLIPKSTRLDTPKKSEKDKLWEDAMEMDWE